MKSLLSLLTGTKKNKETPKVADPKQEALLKQGREQFEKLIKRGLSVPVMLL